MKERYKHIPNLKVYYVKLVNYKIYLSFHRLHIFYGHIGGNYHYFVKIFNKNSLSTSMGTKYDGILWVELTSNK